MKKVAIIGATGMLGQPVTRQFINAKYDVSLLVRDSDKARNLFGNAVNITKADLDDPAALKGFLAGHENLYLNLSVAQGSRENEFQPEKEGLQNVLLAAKEAGIRRIGYISSLIQFYQSSWWVMKIKKNAVEMIKASGIPYSIFYPSAFMESFDKGAYRQGNRIMLAGKSMHAMYLIAGDDYGKQVVKAFEQNNGNNEYPVQGPGGFKVDEAAKIFVQNYKKQKLTIATAPLAIIKFLGMFSPKFSYAAHIIPILNNYPEKFEAQKTWTELGQPQTTFVDYISKI